MMRPRELEPTSGSLFHARTARTLHPRIHPVLQIAIMCVSLLSAACLAQLASAAEADTNAAAAAGGLEEVVVTAEKYNSTIQNTPISMSAITGDQLIAAGITSVEEILSLIHILSRRRPGTLWRLPHAEDLFGRR